MRDARPMVHLHLHTEYSLLDSLCRLDELFRRARDAGMPAVAMTDTSSLHGAWEFQRRARAAGVRPVMGCEIELATGEDGRPGPGLVLLAESDEGWAHLVRLVSAAHLERDGGRIAVSLDRLACHSRGLIALSGGGNGEVNRACLAGDLPTATAAARRYAGIFGRENFFLELQNQSLEGQARVNAALRDLGRSENLACVATNNVHYFRREDAVAHEVLRCVAAGTQLDDPARSRYPSDRFEFCDAAEMYTRFPGDEDAVARTAAIASRCLVEFPEDPALRFPVFPVPEGLPGSISARGHQFALLRQLARTGLTWRMGFNPDEPADGVERDAVARLEHELEIIRRAGFVNHVLVVQDVVRFARDRGIPIGPGGGPLASSLVAWALGMTEVDPLRFGLVFECLLNPERMAVPNLDITIGPQHRADILGHLRRRFGADRVALISTFEKLGARTALRDVGRALGVPPAECDRCARMVPEGADMTIARALHASPELRAALAGAAGGRIAPLAERIEGLPRHTGTHASGVVVGDIPLAGIVPLTRDREGATVTQYDMRGVGGAGLLKLDFASLRPLAVIDRARAFVRRRQEAGAAEEGILLNDGPALRLLREGDTGGIFLLDPPGVRDALRRIGVARFDDLVVVVAMLREAAWGLFDAFARRRQGVDGIGKVHPLLAPIVHETYGMVLYHEQVHLAATTIAGFGPGQAEAFRLAMAHGDEPAIEAFRERFVEGTRKRHRLMRPTIERIFAHLRGFSGHGFSKAVSVAHAQVCFRVAWLKANHPDAFFAAALALDPDRRPALLAEALARGLRVVPPDLNASPAEFEPEAGGIRYGLAAIRHLGGEAVGQWVAERAARGPFADLFDFCRRVDPHHVNRRTVETLVRAGAFDFTGASRSRLVAALDYALAGSSERRRDQDSGQMGLFRSETLRAAGGVSALPDAAPWPAGTLAANERDLLGAALSEAARAESAVSARERATASTAGYADGADGDDDPFA